MVESVSTKTFNALDQARIITDPREPFTVYIDLARKNLNRRYSNDHPDLETQDRKALVEANFYSYAYNAFLEDEGGSVKTESALVGMIEEHNQGSY